MRELKGELKGSGLKIGIAVSRFNSTVTKGLLEGAIDKLTQCGVKEDDIDVVWVPGAFELPQIIKKMAKLKRYDGIISLGCLIRGETPHFEYIASKVASGIAKLNLEHDIPIAFGVLTTDTIEQAMERSGLKLNKGAQAAESLLEMVNLLRRIEAEK